MNILQRLRHLARLKRNEFNTNIAGNNDEARLPFEAIGNYIYVQATIDGQRFGFIVDSAGLNMLSPQATELAGLKESSVHRSHTGAGESDHRVGICKIKRIALGDRIVLTDQRWRVVDLPGLPDGKPLHGVIGIEVFRRFVVRADYEAGELTFTKPNKFHPGKAAIALALHPLRSGVPTITAEVDGLSGRFMVDTGNGGALELFPSFVARHDLLARYDATPPVPVGTGLGGVLHARIARSGTLRLGDVSVDRPLVNLHTSTKGVFASGKIQGNIGGRILKRFTVTFDFSRKRMYLLPNKNCGKPMGDSVFLNRAGLFFKKSGGSYSVVQVLPESPAADSGIEPGDSILAVNGRLAKDIDPMMLSDILRNPTPNTRVQLTIRKGQETRDVLILLQQLVLATGGLYKAGKNV